MLWELLTFTVGLGALYLGAEWLIRGATSVALTYGIRRMVVGSTVVALGTSMPEFVVNLFAAITGEDSIALGNIVGSNICNIGLILGVSSMILPLAVAPGTLRKEYPLMMMVMAMFYLVSLDGVISQLDGLLLVGGLFVFLVFLALDSRRYARSFEAEDIPEMELNDVRAPAWKKGMLLTSGIVFLALGARLMVQAAVTFTEWLGISPVIVGLTVVAVGTSLPELAASVVSALKKDPDMAIGNVLGSNLLNVLFIVGLTSMIQPLRVDAAALTLHFPVMMGFGVLLLPLAWTSYRITRLEGSVLLAAFAGYMIYLVLPYV